MKVFTWKDILSSFKTGVQISYFCDKATGISTGSFDGVHKGHRGLLDTLVEKSKENNLVPGVVTFLRPLSSLKNKKDYSGDISTLSQRLSLFEQLNISFVIIVDFDDSFSKISGTDFFNILMKTCNLSLIAEGIDFRCGYKGSADKDVIQSFAQKNKLQTVFVNPFYFKNENDEMERISSSLIRKMILKGCLSNVEELMERKYEIDLSSSEIIQVLPPDGIYFCKDENNSDVKVKIMERKLLYESKDGVVKTFGNQVKSVIRF